MRRRAWLRWTMTDGFHIGGGLVFAGLLLQLCVGPVAWDAFAWPVNGIVLAGLLTLIAAMSLLRKRVRAIRFLCSFQAAIPAMVYAVVLTIVMGLTPQTSATSDPSMLTGGDLWLNDMLTFWPFVLIYAYMALILGLVAVKQLTAMAGMRRAAFRLLPSCLLHLGLFVAMTTATLGNADMQRLKMITVVGEPECRAMTQEGFLKEIPMTIELKRFIMETYDDGQPKRFASEILVKTKAGKDVRATVDVNKPVEVDGWKIYQYSYDTQMGAMSRTSVLELVCDPWLPLVYAGIYMMLAGAVGIFVFGGRRNSPITKS